MKIYLFLLLIFFPKLILSYMMGIDLGSEYFKVTVIKPGKPFMMMENLLSKTKTENALGLKDDKISYSYDALSKKSKTPSNIFNYLSEYLGREYNDSFISEYKKEFFQSYNLSVEKDTNAITFQFKYNNKDEKLSLVEIYSMIFDYIKFLSEKFTNKEMTDTFITIPSFFDYQQRQAIADALKISKLKLAGMVR
jgi:hypoxia up-regulated 1